MKVKKLLTVLTAEHKDTGWVNIGTTKGTWSYCQYRVKNGFFYVSGYATACAWSGKLRDTIVASGTIPEQYRPLTDFDLIVRVSGARWGQILLDNNGGIFIDRILNGTSSYTTSTWFRFWGCYPI